MIEAPTICHAIMKKRASSSKETIGIDIIQDFQEVTDTILELLGNAKESIEVYADPIWPSIVMSFSPYNRGYIDAKERGVPIKVITEITADNMHYCKEIMKFAELRHLTGITGNFEITETEYIASATLQKEKPATQLIYSNAKNILDPQRFVFRNFWNKAIPAEQRIKEIAECTVGIQPIEEGVEPGFTKVINSQKDIISRARYVIETSNQLSVCSTFDGLKMIESISRDPLEKILEKSQKGEHKGVRWIGTINKDDIDIVKRFLAKGMKVKHVKDTALNFSVTNKEFNFTISNMEGGSIAPSVLISNEQPYIKQFNFMFEQLWSQGIEAEARIKEIELGIEPPRIEIIQNPSLVLQTYKDLIHDTKEEILIIFPTVNTVRRQQEAGIIELLRSKANRYYSKDNHNSKLKIRILMPYHPFIEKVVQNLKQYPDNIDVRFVEQSTTSAGLTMFLVVDRSSSLVMEIKDNSTETFVEAAGLSIFSNSRAGILSTVSIFETLWTQAELYEQVKYVNEQLQLHDTMQREFINIAAHELRTPIQPLLVAAEILESELFDKERIEVTKGDIEVIIRNARRLERLSSDVLEVSRIESRTLELHKEPIDLKQKIQNTIADVKSYIKSNQQLEIVFEPFSANNNDNPVIVEADKSKLFEVLSNIIRNAIKFTDNGTIKVSLEKREDYGCAVISIRDTGAGIDPDIMPRLFEKFVSGSQTEGTGLGLFISKAIVEAHGGRIWAKNNNDGKGATFTFTLPLASHGKDIDNNYLKSRPKP